MKYRYCKLKNIGLPQDDSMGVLQPEDRLLNPHLDIVNSLPNDCIRLSWAAKDWCNFYCGECFE